MKVKDKKVFSVLSRILIVFSITSSSVAVRNRNNTLSGEGPRKRFLGAAVMQYDEKDRVVISLFL